MKAENHNTSPTGKNDGLLGKDLKKQGLECYDSITLTKTNQY